MKHMPPLTVPPVCRLRHQSLNVYSFGVAGDFLAMILPYARVGTDHKKNTDNLFMVRTNIGAHKVTKLVRKQKTELYSAFNRIYTIKATSEQVYDGVWSGL